MTDRSEPRKAYMVTEAAKGEHTFLVYANSIREIRENWPAVEKSGIDAETMPAGLRDVRRMPSDDR